MIKNIRKKGLLLLCTIPLLLSACSYKEMEDSLKSKLNKEEIQEANTTKVPETDTEATENKQVIYKTGDTVIFSYDETETYEYTLNGVHLSSNIKDAGLNNSDFLEHKLFGKDGEIDSEFQLVTVDLTVKNVNYQGSEPDAETPILFIDPTIGFKSGIEDPNGPWTFYADYFSHGIIDADDSQKRYYYFPLAVGAQVDVKLGWFVPTDQVKEEPLYYIIGSAFSPENYKYFDLNLVK